MTHGLFRKLGSPVRAVPVVKKQASSLRGTGGLGSRGKGGRDPLWSEDPFLAARCQLFPASPPCNLGAGIVRAGSWAVRGQARSECLPEPARGPASASEVWRHPRGLERGPGRAHEAPGTGQFRMCCVNPTPGKRGKSGRQASSLEPRSI